VLGGVGVLTLRAERAPPATAIALMLVVGWWLVAPSLPVQAGLWVLPLLALTARSWRVVVAWGAFEAIYAMLTWLFLYGLSVEDRGVPASWYSLAVLARVSAWIWVAVVAWRNAGRAQLESASDRDEAPGRRLPLPV
jgi:hypothetical protein